MPKLCLDPAFLPLLASLAYCRISKLRSMKDGSKFKSPSGHHEINSLEKKPGSMYFTQGAKNFSVALGGELVRLSP